MSTTAEFVESLPTKSPIKKGSPIDHLRAYRAMVEKRLRSKAFSHKEAYYREEIKKCDQALSEARPPEAPVRQRTADTPKG